MNHEDLTAKSAKDAKKENGRMNDGRPIVAGCPALLLGFYLLNKNFRDFSAFRG